MPGVLIVTGSSRGIGAAIARLAGRRGWRVGVNYRSDAAAAAAVAEAIATAGGQALAVQADVTDERDVARLFDTVVDRFGPVGGLVNCAGLQGGRAALADLDPAVLRRVLDVNVVGTVLCTREAARRMGRAAGGVGGAVVNLSSLVAQSGGFRLSHYAASKAAISAFTTSAARELAEEGIRLNAVAPGVIATDQQPLDDPAWVEHTARSIPLGRLGTPEEVAEAVLWLLSDAAAYVAGAILPVAGAR